MKIRKNFIYYIVAWVLALGLFNVIAFVTPRYQNVYTNELGEVIKEGDKLQSPVFWAAYALITISFIGQLVCAYFALSQDKADKRFLNMPMLATSFTTLIVTGVVGTICMGLAFLGAVPAWIGIIVCVIVLVVSTISVIKAKTAGDHAAAVEQNVKVKTVFMKMLIADADSLMAKAEGDELKALAREVYEEIRYSDPMSDPALEGVENKLQTKFLAFSKAVQESNVEEAQAVSKELLAVVYERNAKCKILK